MADNVNITPGVGASVAADEVGGNLYQRVKPSFGDDGFAIDVSAANPLPVIIAGGVMFDSLENIRAGIDALNRRTNMVRVNASGMQWAVLDSTSTLGTVNQVTSVPTVTNLNQFAGVTALDTVRSMNRAAYNTGVRSNVTIT